jgi:prepilin peptidase CpaA
MGDNRMLIDGILLTILLICVITDLKSRKIYNKVIAPGLAIAFSVQFAVGGWQALGDAAVGFLVGLSVLLIPYLLGGMGAGDVKLMALVGALKGTMFVLVTSVYMALLGGVIALFVLLCRKGVKKRMQGMLISLIGLRYGMKIPLIADKEAMTASYPYGVAIAGGAVLCLWLKGWGIV